MVFNNDRNLTYSCQYVPTMEGEYTVSTYKSRHRHMLHTSLRMYVQ